MSALGAVLPLAQVDSGDTAWMLTSTALVLLMTIGLGVFYAGLVRAKNTLNTFMMCVSAHGDRRHHLGAARLLARLRRRSGDARRARPRRPQRGRLRAARRRHDPGLGLHGLPGDLLHHHRGADLRRRGRADALRRLDGLRRALVGAGLRGARPLGLRRRLAGRGGPARLRRRRPGRDGLGLRRPGRGAGGRRSAKTTGARRCSPTTPSTSCSAQGCSGSAGSASTAAAASRPATRACSPSSTRC